MDIMKELSNIGIVPVIALDDAAQALPLAKALKEGGLPAMEITFRTAAGQEAIKLVSEAYPDILVGAGTVLTVAQCKAAVENGAKFIVSPGYFDDVVNYCVENNIPVLPGTSTPSEMTKAVNAGLKVVKFFPAEQNGGITFLKAVAPVFPLNFMPTGGVSTKNMMDYLNFDRIVACGGTWMVKKDMINAGQFDTITVICKDAVKTMLGFTLLHVGINCADDEEAQKTAKTFETLFGFEPNNQKSATFAGTYVECMKGCGRGTKGHIAIGTNHVERAVYHLKKQGVEFIEESMTYDEKGNLKLVYLKDEIGGFAVHLVKK